MRVGVRRHQLIAKAVFEPVEISGRIEKLENREECSRLCGAPTFGLDKTPDVVGNQIEIDQRAPETLPKSFGRDAVRL